MNAATVLEGRYLRLLAMCPAEHRRKHQDEMLGVLMTGARAGQRWPTPADSLDLIAGALRIRLRLPHGEVVRQGWADALGVTGVLMPSWSWPIARRGICRRSRWCRGARHGRRMPEPLPRGSSCYRSRRTTS